jgi:hypothetical protein
MGAREVSTVAVVKTRDYAAEIRALIDEETGRGPYNSRAIARDIVEKLTANDLELLQGWLLVHAEQLLWSMINERDRSTRAHARTASSRSAFGAAAAQHEQGDRETLADWLGTPFAVEDGTRRALGTLAAADLTFVASRYGDRARQNSFEEVFFRALARKVETGTVADHFTNEQIAELRRSLG